MSRRTIQKSWRKIQESKPGREQLRRMKNFQPDREDTKSHQEED